MKVVILRGIPGSGKSTYANKISQPHRICSADKFFMIGEKYHFEPKKLAEAQGQCLKQFIVLVQSDYVSDKPPSSPIVVDNTSIEALDIAPYIAIAQAHGAEIEIVQLQCEPSVAAARNVHGVPGGKIVKMFDALDRARLPDRWMKFRTLA